MTRQRMTLERRQVLRRQAIEAGVRWSEADAYEDDAEVTVEDALASMDRIANAPVETVEEALARRRAG